MTFYTLKTTPHQNTFLLQKSNYVYKKKPSNKPPDPDRIKKPRKQSEVGTDSYKRSLRRAFARAKALAFFNPDLNTFITLTYRTSDHTPEQVLQDVKNFIKTEIKNYSQETPPTPLEILTKRTQSATPSSNFSTSGPPQQAKDVVKFTLQEDPGALEKEHKNKANPFKYIYVMEYQKRGSIHVHMICNNKFTYQINKNGYRELKYWPKGYSSVLDIRDFDNNFRPYLYLFKYMSKAQRIGKSFIHVSRNFDKIEEVRYDLYIDKLVHDNRLFKEDYEFYLDGDEHVKRITKEYYRTPATANYPEED